MFLTHALLCKYALLHLVSALLSVRRCSSKQCESRKHLRGAYVSERFIQIAPCFTPMSLLHTELLAADLLNRLARNLHEAELFDEAIVLHTRAFQLVKGAP